MHRLRSAQGDVMAGVGPLAGQLAAARAVEEGLRRQLAALRAEARPVAPGAVPGGSWVGWVGRVDGVGWWMDWMDPGFYSKFVGGWIRVDGTSLLR
jgi:hypothetical protein